MFLSSMRKGENASLLFRPKDFEKEVEEHGMAYALVVEQANTSRTVGC